MEEPRAVITMSQLESLEGHFQTAKTCLEEVATLISDFITQAEASNFTDRHGHALEMNAAYRALRESVSE